MLEGNCLRKTAAAKPAGSYCFKTLLRQKRHMWLLEQEMDMVNWLGKFSRDEINAKSSEPRHAILLPREGTIRLELQSIFRSEPFPKAECSPLIRSSSPFWGVYGGEGSWKQQPGKYIVLWGSARFQLCIESVFCSEEFRRCVRRQPVLTQELCGSVSCGNKTRKLMTGEKGIYFQIYSAEWVPEPDMFAVWSDENARS